MISYTDAQIVELIGERFVNKELPYWLLLCERAKGITENFEQMYVWDLYERGLMKM